MHKGRLEAFSDGVMAIIITIMVLELKVPHGEDFSALVPLLPVFLSYVLSFIYVAIYWNNHHHLFQAVKSVNGSVLWANLHLLFWLSLTPFTTAWMGENHFASVPVALYGCTLFMAGVGYYLLVRALLKVQGNGSTLARALGSDFKGRLSNVLNGAGIGLAFVHPYLGYGTYVLVALIWLVPDKRIERTIQTE
jgi:uncharacterized membrane protein